jgi:tellurite resistance protein TerC
VLDLTELKVKDAMRPRETTQTIQLQAAWEANWEAMRQTRFSRYPLLDGANPKPVGIVHVKDLFFTANPAAELRKVARPCREVRDDLPLEEVLARFQRRFDQMAIVINSNGDWTGVITIEDVIEEIVGKIDDEFDTVRPGRSVSLADALSPGRVVFNLEAQSMKEAIREIIERTPREELPADPEAVIKAVLQREEAMPTYVGNGLALPHGRLDIIDRPLLFFARSDTGVPLETTNERAELIFLLLTPRSMARLQPRILADIAGLFDSEYVSERLRMAKTPDEVIEAIRAGLQVVLD